MDLTKDKRRFLLAIAMAGAALCVSPPTMAHGHGADRTRADLPQASLQAQASTEVAHDTVQIVLAAELRASSQTDVAQALNARLDSVMQQAKEAAGVTASSGSYRIWPSTNQDGKIAEWRGRAEILLNSTDFMAASRLAASLGDRMPISGLSFSVSKGARAAAEGKLLGEAVAAFKDRAQALTKALGFAAYRYGTIDLGGNGQAAPMPRMMMAKAADSMAAAPIEGGTETITVSVSGTILLQLADKATGQ